MSDEENNNIKDTINAVTELAKEIPIYEDTIQPIAQETGKALQTVGRAVNVALMPVKGLVWGFEQIESFVEVKVGQKLRNIPLEEICSPNPTVAGPAFESLKYTGHEEALREMYANLLANAMDINTKDDAHPAFVEVIKQLSAEEAKLLLFLSEKEVFPEVCSYSDWHVVSGGWPYNDSGFTSNQVQNDFRNLCSEFESNLDIDAALDNYRRLQILDTETQNIQNIQDNGMGFHDNVRELSELLELKIEYTERLFFTSFGKKFVEICVIDKI